MAYAKAAHPVAGVRADDNNLPSFPAGTPRSFTVSEHAAVGTVIGTVRGSDDDSDDILSHILTTDDDVPVNADKFAIDMATGRITVAGKLDFETAPEAAGTRTGRDYTVTITVYDPSGTNNEIARPINIQVTDQNDAPMTPTVGAPETDRQPTLLDGSSYVEGSSYTVPENHAVKDAVDDPNTQEEDPMTAVVIATFTVTDTPDTERTDPDSGDGADTLELTTGGDDGGLFSLTDTDDFGGTPDNNTYELVFKESPNYESPADADGNDMYHVTIITTDNEGASSSLPLVITVMNVDEEGKVTLSNAQPAIGEPITATLTDPDLKIVEVEWQWRRSDSTDGFIAIQGATSDTYTPVMSVPDDPITSENEGVDGDEGMYLEVIVKYQDNAKDTRVDAEVPPSRLR